MGWLFSCLGSHKNGRTNPRVFGRGRGLGGSDTYHGLSSQFGGNAPRIEDFLQPRRVSCSDVEYSPPIIVGSRFSDAATGKPFQHRNSQQADVEELEEEVEILRRKLAAEAATAEQLRQEVRNLRSGGNVCNGGAIEDRGKSLERERLIPGSEVTVRSNWNLGNRPSAPPKQRKSFSELLIETDAGTSKAVKGPLALKARAVAAERAARNLYAARPVAAASPSPDFPTFGDHHKSTHGQRIPRNARATHGSSGQKPGDSLLNWLKQENESISQQQQRLLLDVSKPSSGGRWWHNSSLASSNKQEVQSFTRPYVTTLARVDSNEALDIQWIEMRSGENSPCRSIEVAKCDDITGLPRTSGFFLNVAAEAFVRDCQKVAKSSRIHMGKNSSGNDHSRMNGSEVRKAFGAPGPCFSFKATDMNPSTLTIVDKENDAQSQGQLAPLDYSHASYVAIPRPSRKKHHRGSAPKGGAGAAQKSTRWTLSDDCIDLHPSKDRRWHAENAGSNKIRRQTGCADAKSVESVPDSDSSTESQMSNPNPPHMEGGGGQEAPKLRSQTSNTGDLESARRSVTRFAAEEERMKMAEQRGDVQESENVGDVVVATDFKADLRPGNEKEEQEEPGNENEVQEKKMIHEGEEEDQKLRVSNQIEFWNSLQKKAAAAATTFSFTSPTAADKENASAGTGPPSRAVEELKPVASQPGTLLLALSLVLSWDFSCSPLISADEGSLWVRNQVKLWNSLHEEAAATIKKPSGTPPPTSDCRLIKSGATKDGIDRRTSRRKNDELPAVKQSGEVRTLRESTANNMTLDNAAARSTPNKAGKGCAIVVASSGLPSSGVQVSGSRREIGDCFSLQRTRRHVGAITVQTSEECPQNETAMESVSTSLQDVKPEDRPIVGSVGSHWEAPARTHLHIWDGKGIPNSTYKYREDQIVNWQTMPFEEQLEHALATQESCHCCNRHECDCGWECKGAGDLKALCKGQLHPHSD